MIHAGARRRPRARVTLVLLALVAALGCVVSLSAKASAAKSPISIALITFDVTGEDNLTPMEAGANGALKVINAAGGINGHPVKLVTCNSMLETTAADDCAHSTISAHPVAMIGCELSWSASGLAVYSAAKTPSLNCPNTPEDFTSKWEFAENPGATGDNAAAAAYACQDPKIKVVDELIIDIPAEHDSFNNGTARVLQNCGKTANAIYVPPTAVDVTPYAVKAAQDHPDLVLSNLEDASVPPEVQALEQQGIPAGHIIAPDVDYTHTEVTQSPILKGTLVLNEYDSWAPSTPNPEVTAYLKAMKGSSTDPRDASVEWGYSLVMWIYDAAKHIGSGFNTASLVKYLRTAKNVHVPLSNVWINPGPMLAPSMHQPACQIVEWNGKTFTPLKVGPKKDGWITGFGTLP